MKPIIIFENKQQALSCLKEWKTRLSLSDWIIDVHLHYNDPVIAPAWGKSTIWRAIHIAEIHIPMPRPGQINPFPQKYCQELILVHELMHIKLPGYEADPNTTEGFYYENEQHAILESVAKALIMARYDIGLEWFEN